jgi:hypothetical protein
VFPRILLADAALQCVSSVHDVYRVSAAGGLSSSALTLICDVKWWSCSSGTLWLPVGLVCLCSTMWCGWAIAALSCKYRHGGPSSNACSPFYTKIHSGKWAVSGVPSRGIEVRGLIPVQAWSFLPPPHTMNIEDLSLVAERPEREADHPSPCSVKLKNTWSFNSIPPLRLYGFLIKHRDICTGFERCTLFGVHWLWKGVLHAKQLRLLLH